MATSPPPPQSPLRHSANRTMSLARALLRVSNTPSFSALPPEVLERILAHAVVTCAPAGGLRERQWLTAADLARAAPLALVCRSWCLALRSLVNRFSFFALPAAAAPFRGSPTLLLPPLALCPNLRALQLFLRPKEAAAFAGQLEPFLAREECVVSTMHICFGRESAPAPAVVSDILTAVAQGAGTRLSVLSLDYCGGLSTDALAMAARHAPNVTTLALDYSFPREWHVLGDFVQLRELSLRNCKLDDAGLVALLRRTPYVETLALGYQGPLLTERGTKSLSQLRYLRAVELARCAGLGDTAVVMLADVSSLQRVALLHIDVSPCALVRLAQAMGPRLQALVVTSVRARAGDLGTSHGSSGIANVASMARRYCLNLKSLQFAPAQTPHWSERAYVEALRFVPEPTRPVLVKATRQRPRRIGQFLAGLCGRAKDLCVRYRR